MADRASGRPSRSASARSKVAQRRSPAVVSAHPVRAPDTHRVDGYTRSSMPPSEPQPAVQEPPRNFVIGAWVITALLLWLVLRFDLLPALLAGLLVFELV